MSEKEEWSNEDELLEAVTELGFKLSFIEATRKSDGKRVIINLKTGETREMDDE